MAEMRLSVMRALGLVIAAVCLLVAGAAHASTNGSRGAQSLAPYPDRLPQDLPTLARVFGIRFAQQAVPSGRQPALPGGAAGIGSTSAVALAIEHTPAGVDHVTGRVLPGVRVTASYGIFSDDHYAARVPSGPPRPLYERVPAWIVTFSGSGTVLYSTGPSPPGTANHEVGVVVDAATGRYLLAYSYR